MSESIKRDPHMLGETPLEFDNFETEEILAKTDKEKSQLYLEKFRKNIRPFTRYKDYFETSEKSSSHILAEIKNYYIRYVLKEGWSEKKYTAAINNILAHNAFLGPKMIEDNGRSFDRGTLIVRTQSRRRRL